MKKKGTVKWFSPEKGFGFILTENGMEVFVHHSDIEGEGYRILHEEEEVEFEVVDTNQGYQARRVIRIRANGTD